MGLLKTVATVAVASSVHGRVQRRQQQRWAAQDAQAAGAAAPVPDAAPAPAPAAPAPAAAAPPAADDMARQMEMLRQLGELRDSGVLTEHEFEAKKAKILLG